MRGKPNIKIILLYIAISLFVCFLIEFISNFKILKLNDSEKGIIYLTENMSEVRGFNEKNDKYYLESDQGRLKWDLGGRFVNKFAYEYSCKDLLTSTIEVGILNAYGKEETIKIKDTNPKLVTKSVVNINKNVLWISVKVEGGSEHSNSDNDIVISSPQIINEVLINKYRISLVLLFELMVGLLIAFRTKVKENIEYGFLIIALTLGLSMLICFPTNKVGWDEESHFNWAYRISLLPGGEKVSTETSGQFAVTIYNWPHSQLASYEEKEQMNIMQNKYYESGDQAVTIASGTWGVYTPGLIFQAFAIKLARVLGGSFGMIYFAGRFAGLLLHVFLCFFAIRLIPIGKRILTFISLMPTSIFLAVCYSYDTSVFGFICLGLALLLREWLLKEKEIKFSNLIISAACFMWGSLPKAIYAPIILIAFLIPTSRYKNKKQAILYRGIVSGVFIALMLSFILPQLLSPNVLADTRGGSVDPGQQMKYVLGQPLVYAGVLLKNIFSTLPDFAFGEACYRLMGHLQTSGFQYLVPMMAFILILTDHEDKSCRKIVWKQRVYIFILLGAAVVLIWTALYLAFTVPGDTMISGVQGRYYRPLLLPLYLILGNDFVQLKVSKEKYNAFILGLCTVITGSAVIGVFSTFCL